MQDLFTKYLRTGQHHKRKVIGLRDAEWQPLLEDTYIGQWTFPKGSIFKIFETANFGWIVFHADTTLANGTKPIQRIFKW